MPCSLTYFNKDPNFELVEDSKTHFDEGLEVLDDVCANATPSSADLIPEQTLKSSVVSTKKNSRNCQNYGQNGLATNAEGLY